jgi:transposase InsO family protein
MIEDAARILGVTPQTVYRKLAAHGYKPGRKRRTDKGRTCVDRDTALLACGMVVKATRANGKRTMPLAGAVKILEHSGMGCKINTDTGEVTMPAPATVARVARRYGCHPEQLRRGKPPVELASPHPNWCWQVDASVCVLFYLPGGKMGVRPIDDRQVYKNKPHNEDAIKDKRVIRWVVTDHYSGAFFLRYSTGAEDSLHLLDALFEAMCRRDDSENDCLYGVPRILVADKGSSITSGHARAAFDALGVRLVTHKPGNPRAKGQVEQAQNLVETQFEGRLRMYEVTDLPSLNAAADQWRVAYNLTAKHSRHGRTRHAMWRVIREDHLRIPASMEALRDLAHSGPARATVTRNLTIVRTLRGYGRQEYDVRAIPGILPKMDVSLQINPFRAPCVDMTLEDAEGNRRTWTLEPIERDEAGFRVGAALIGEEYKALADTAADTALKDIHLRAHKAETLAEAEKAEAGKARIYADIDPMADVRAVPLRQYMPKRGRDLTLAPTLKEEPPLSFVDAVFELRNRTKALGLEWTEVHVAALQKYHGPDDSIPAAKIASLLAIVLDEAAAKRASGMRLVSGGAA